MRSSLLLLLLLLAAAVLASFNHTRFLTRERARKRGQDQEFVATIKRGLSYATIRSIDDAIRADTVLTGCALASASWTTERTLLVVRCTQGDPYAVQALVQRAIDSAQQGVAASLPAVLLEENKPVLLVPVAAERASPAPMSAFGWLQQQSVFTETGVPWDLDRLDQHHTSYDSIYSFRTWATGMVGYVVDTGIDAGHTEFGGRASLIANAIDGNNADCNGHGTHVAGLVGGHHFGVAKNATIYACKALDCDGYGDTSTVIGCILAIADHAANSPHANDPFVINFSLTGGMSSAMADAIADLLAAFHVIVVAAAGNANANACYYAPAGIPGVFTVGASAANDQRAGFSNFGNCVDLYAPGVSVLSAYPGGHYALMSGTSQAAPLVAGVCLQVLDQIRQTYPVEGAGAAHGPASLSIEELAKAAILSQRTKASNVVYGSFDATSENAYGVLPPESPPPPPIPPGNHPPFVAPNLPPPPQPLPPHQKHQSGSFADFVGTPLGLIWFTVGLAVVLW